MIQIQAETTVRRSPLERLVQRVERMRVAPLLVTIIVAIIFAAVANVIAVRFAQLYHNYTMYYPDASAYRQQAVLVYQTLHTQGLGNALKQALALKDGLDIAVRVVLLPETLRLRFGHVAVVLPFMIVFIALAIWYVFLRTRSLLSGVVVVAFLFCSGLIYGPYAGIADYWKDSLGTWLLGSACIAWLLSKRLVYWGWSVCCSCLLGLLVLQRTGAAVYTAPLFAVLFLLAMYERIRNDGAKKALWRGAAFVLPALIFLSVLVSAQFQSLYTYYFGFGYAYGTMSFTARTLLETLLAYAGLIIYLVPLACLLCLLSISAWREQLIDIATAAWFVVGFPALIILSRSLYVPGFYACWVVLLVVFLASVTPRMLVEGSRRVLLFVLIGLALLGSVLQYQSALFKIEQPEQNAQANRAFYLQIAQIILSQPAPQIYKLIFYESGTDFWNLLYFDVRHTDMLNVQESSAYFSVHDSYYQGFFKGRSAQQIVDENIQRLEQTVGTIVVADCEPQNILKRTWFAPNPSVDFLKNGNPLAAEIAIRMAEYMLDNDHWKVLNRLDSPFGCMFVYRYSDHPFTKLEKWQDVSFSKPVTDIPLDLALAPAVRIYDYESRYQPENVKGIYYQWMPSGENALQLSLFSEQARDVSFEARAIPGPARSSPERTMLISLNGRSMSAHLAADQNISFPLSLQPGINHLSLSVQEAANIQPQPGADQRELMLLLESPHLASASK